MILISKQDYQEMRDEGGGYCVRCREPAYGVEPDARRYECESCGEMGVYGIEEILLMEFLDIVDDRNFRNE